MFNVGDYVIGKRGELIKISIQPESDRIVFGENVMGRCEVAEFPMVVDDPAEWLLDQGYFEELPKLLKMKRWPDVIGQMTKIMEVKNGR